MRVHVHCTAALAQGAIGIVSLDTAYSDAFLIDVEVNKTGCHMHMKVKQKTKFTLYTSEVVLFQQSAMRVFI